MREHYRDNPGVEVILDRRYGGPNDRRRRRDAAACHDDRRVTRDRRRARATGTFPRIEAFARLTRYSESAEPGPYARMRDAAVGLGDAFHAWNFSSISSSSAPRCCRVTGCAPSMSTRN